MLNLKRFYEYDIKQKLFIVKLYKGIINNITIKTNIFNNYRFLQEYKQYYLNYNIIISSSKGDFQF